MTYEELKIILEKHKKFLKREDGGERADFSHRNLSGMILRDADLRFAIFSFSNLESSCLQNANLAFADFLGANLYSANLRDADLTCANFTLSNLAYAWLKGAIIEQTNFEYANLAKATLDEREQIRKGMFLKESMIGYERCRDGNIVTLEIPKGAIVYSIDNRQCRTNVAKVIDIDNGLEQAVSMYDKNITYHKDEMVRLDEFDCMYNDNHGGGIRFFHNKEEAERYS